MHEREGECKDFHCRLCGSTKYKEIRDSNGIIGPAGRSWVAYNICSGCGVLFADPKKFSKTKK